MALDQELRRIAEVAVTYCRDGEELSGIVPAEPAAGRRLYVCAYRDGAETRWLVLDATGVAVEERALVHDAVSIAALCEVAEDAAGLEAREPRVASPALLDELGANAGPQLAATVKGAAATIEDLVRDVERGYKRTLS